jgi:hypothetical protein
MKQVIDLLGKKVSFSTFVDTEEFINIGTVTEIILSLKGEHYISIDEGEFCKLSDLNKFLVFHHKDSI